MANIKKKLLVGAITMPLAIRNLVFPHQTESSVMKHAGRTALKLMLNHNLSVQRARKTIISGIKRKE